MRRSDLAAVVQELYDKTAVAAARFKKAGEERVVWGSKVVKGPFSPHGLSCSQVQSELRQGRWTR